ncbi:type II secretion system protein [Neorhodopirellula lusitana]|uniref:type II secretion system protein n=1 Tax=Neorhodopirellula lusitana TaxID=445327 RepID=UPI00384B19A4
MICTATSFRTNSNRRHFRRGISLLETVACVAIVATMSTAIVGVMQNSTRVATASRGAVGAPAQARQALRQISDQLHQWDQTDGIQLISGQTIVTGSQKYRYSKQVSSSTKGGYDLVLEDGNGNELVCVQGTLVDFKIDPIPSGTAPIGIEMRLRLKLNGVLADELRSGELEADVRTQVCFPAQLRAKP